MTYDPDRTNVLPSIEPAFPITEELPVVRPRGSGGPSRFFLGLLATLLIAGIAAIAAILVINDQRSDQTAGGDGPQPTAGPTADAGDTTAPTPVELDADEPSYWQVVGVPDGLNVRSGPGTTNDIIGSLRLGDRHILATGQRATANGGEWKQITFGESDTTGWVSARFLSPDTPPDESAPTPTPVPAGSTSVVCFASQTTPLLVARLTFTDRTEITGVIRTITAQSSTDQNLTGTLNNGTAQITISDPASNQSSEQTWSFEPATVDIGNGRTLRVVECNSVAGELP